MCLFEELFEFALTWVLAVGRDEPEDKEDKNDENDKRN